MGPLDMEDDIDSSWQWGTDQNFFSIPSRFQEIRINIGFSQGLDWREVMSWYTVGGESYTVIDIARQETWFSPLRASVIARGSAHSESWDLGDDWPSWRGDPGGLFVDAYSERSVWDPGIEGSIPGGLTQAHNSTRRFVWDPGIGSQLHRVNKVAHIFGLLGASNLGAKGL